MFKKFIYFFVLLFTISLLAFTIFLNSTYSGFNATNVKTTISLLSSDALSGRLPGTSENVLAANIIESNFKKNSLKPINGSYREDFSTLCPVSTNTEPYLKILKNGELEEELKYGIDFKEDMLNFKSNQFTFSNKNKINIYNNYIAVLTSEGKFLFYIPESNNFSFRSSFVSDHPFDAIIMITKNTKNKIIDSINSGKEISLSIPFTTEEKTLSNIIGVIEGNDKTLPPFIITAHFDHLGKDGLGNNYRGALDNASGTAFILELQRSISTFGKPNRDIIFVALNAEEFGLLGSKYFAENNYFNIKNSKVMNFDMIGSKNFPITFMQGTAFKGRESKLFSSLKRLCNENNVKYEIIYQDSSDHTSFNNLGIDAISFCHSDLSKIHTPKDTIDYIDTDSINTVYNIVNKEIKTTCYSNFTLFIYSKNSILLLSLITMLLILWGTLDKSLFRKK